LSASQQVDAALARLTLLFPKLIDLSLDRMHRLLGDLGHPEQRLPPVIHVAGTNGKGSTVATMRAVLEASGYKVHVYTSPHLVRFAERIRLVGDLIDETLLLSLLEHVEEANAGKPITFFEVTTAVAFLAFARIPADITLLEVGLGGRFDATNVVAHPKVTVLTSISMDHMQYLGDTLAAIAGEKAAIMKPGVPCVSVAQKPEALAVIEQYARAVGSRLVLQDRDWRVSTPREGSLSFEGETARWSTPAPSLPGRHQFDNAGLAFAALEQTGLPIPAFGLRSGMRNIDWPARAQRLSEGPLVGLLPVGWELWLDGGHNEGAGGVIAALAAEQWSDAPLHIVCGMLSTKAAVDFLRHLVPHAASFTAVPIANDMAYTPDNLAAAARAAGFEAPDISETPDHALHAIIATGKRRSRVLICGSLYLAGEILRDNR
jgi:dihydrofolate synthase/folylpolyglutamate synthase